jgi:hypothetical protein
VETINDKYKRVRPLIKDGDLILFHGTGLMARIIQLCDRCHYNHIGVVIEKLGALYIVDSNESGVQADRLSWRINKYRRGGNFIVIQPTKEDSNNDLGALLKRADANWIRYDYFNGLKELVNRAFGLNFRITNRDEHDICSDYVSGYAIRRNLVNNLFIRKSIQFPQDYIRYRNLATTKIIN